MPKGMLRVAVLMLPLAVVSCGDATGPEDGAVDASFTTDASSYQPYGIATLRLNGPAPAADVLVDGWLDSTAVVLAVTGDSALAFLVPSVAPGTRTLSFTAAGRDYSGVVQVAAAAAIADPESVIRAATDRGHQLIAGLRAQVWADTSSYVDSASVYALLDMAADSLAAAEASLASLSAEEKAVVAQFLAANFPLIDPAAVSSLAMAAPSWMPLRCAEMVDAAEASVADVYQCLWVEMARGWVHVGGAFVVGKLAAMLPFPANAIGVGLATGYALTELGGFMHALTGIVAVHGLFVWDLFGAAGDATLAVLDNAATSVEDYVRVEVFGQDPNRVGSMRVTEAASQGMSVLTDDRPVTFSFAPRIRNVQPGDDDAPFGWLSAGLSVLDRYNSIARRLGERFVVDLRPASSSWMPAVPHDRVSVEVVQNDAVRVLEQGGAGDRVTVRFGTDRTTTQTFAYDVVYASGVYPPLRVRYHAELRPQPPYELAFRDGPIVPDTLRLAGGFWHYFDIRDGDGSPLPAEHYVPYAELANNTNTAVSLDSRYGDRTFDFGALIPDGSTFARTDVDVIVHADNGDGSTSQITIRRLTLEVVDSAAWYHNRSVGGWTVEDYGYDDIVDATEYWTLNADGTGRRASPYYGTMAVDWYVERAMTADVVTYNLVVEWGDCCGQAVPLATPQAPHEYSVSGNRFVVTQD